MPVFKVDLLTDVYIQRFEVQITCAELPVTLHLGSN